MLQKEKGRGLIRHCFFTGEYMKRNFVCQDDLATKYWFRCRSLCEGCIAFDKSAHLVVDLPAAKAIFSSIQDISFKYPESTLYDHIKIEFFNFFNILFINLISVFIHLWLNFDLRNIF